MVYMCICGIFGREITKYTVLANPTYMHRINIVLANPTYMHRIYIWFWSTIDINSSVARLIVIN
jgi:hypothetical protein